MLVAIIGLVVSTIVVMLERGGEDNINEEAQGEDLSLSRGPIYNTQTKGRNWYLSRICHRRAVEQQKTNTAIREAT